MDFIQYEAIDESQQNKINFSNNDDDEKTEQDEDFIDDTEPLMKAVSFYRTFDPENINQYNKLPNQTRNPKDGVYEDSEMFFGTEDTQPVLFAPENREYAEFDKFEGFKNLSKNSKIHFKI